MSPAAAPDVAFTAAACLLAVAGVVLGAWALLWDRPRGRRRCPKCWYSMNGVPGLTCPECGGKARSERRLLKTRRRWRWAIPACLLLYASVGLLRVSQEGIGGMAPTAALLAGVRLLPFETPAADPGIGFFLASEKSIAGWCANALTVRAKSGMWWLEQEAAWRTAHARIESELGKHPPRVAFALKQLLSATLPSEHPPRDARIRGLAAVWLEGPKIAPAGMPIYFTVETDGFGDEDVLVELRAGWPGAASVRTRTLTPHGEWTQAAASFPGTYYKPVVCLGTPPSPAEGIEVTATFRRGWANWDRGAEELPVVAVRTFRVPIRIVAREECPLKAVNEPWPFRGHSFLSNEPYALRRNHYQPGKWELLMYALEGAGAGVTYGARIEVRYEGEPYFRGEVCQWHDAPPLRFPWGLTDQGLYSGISLTQVAELPDEPENMGTWTVRFTGDEAVARQNHEAVWYWRGQVELPLAVRRRE